MGKAKRAKQSPKARFTPFSKVSDDSKMKEDDEPVLVENRSAMEKRHHFEIKQFRKEEAELRRLRTRIKKKDPASAAERKRKLQEIKDKNEELKKRHEDETANLIENSKSEDEDV